MNPSSLGLDISAVQRQKDMYEWFGSMLVDDEGCSYRIIFFSGIRELTAFGSPSTIENYISARQQPERSGAHESDEGGE